MSYRNSLLLRLVSTILLAALLYGGIAGHRSYRNAQHESGAVFDAQMTQMAQTLLAIGVFIDDEHAADLGKLTSRYQQPVYFQLWREEKGAFRPVLRSRDDDTDFPFYRTLAEGFSDRVIGGHHWRFYRQSHADPSLDVVVGQNDAARDEIAKAIAWRDIAPFIYGLPVLGLMATALVVLSLHPLRRLAHDLRSRSPQQLTPLDLTYLPTEMRPPVEALNNLLLQFSRALERERRFTSDAAHELRTPLAALRAQLDAARVAENMPAAQSDSIDKACQATQRLQHLVTQLLLLCRLDVSAYLERGLVRLDEVAIRLCADLAPDAVDKNIDLSLKTEPADLTDANQELLYVLMRNLVDNAIRYTPENGTITVAIRRQSEAVVLEVGDSGCGVPKENREHLGQRFRRLTPSQAAGVGLGLSIVSRVADIHRGRVSYSEDPALGGLLVTVRFPAQRS